MKSRKFGPIEGNREGYQVRFLQLLKEDILGGSGTAGTGGGESA